MVTRANNVSQFYPPNNAIFHKTLDCCTKVAEIPNLITNTSDEGTLVIGRLSIELLLS